MRTKTLLTTVLTLALLYAGSFAAEKKSIESNEEGDITLDQPTTVGNLTLQPGSYQLEEDDKDGEHFVRFTQVTLSKRIQTSKAYTGWVTDRQLKKVGEVKCNPQPLEEKAQTTTATILTENGAQRIIDVTIKGKKTAFVF